MTNTAAGRLADKLAKRYLPPVSIVKPAPTLPPRRAPPKYPTKKPQNPRTTLRFVINKATEIFYKPG